MKNALEARGYYLARGDRRGVVAVDWKGEIYALARWSGVRTKDVEERLGSTFALESVEKVQRMIASRMTEKLAGFASDIKLEFDHAKLGLKDKRDRLVAQQRAAREDLKHKQAERWTLETLERAARFRNGIRGIWDWLVGRKSRVHASNLAEIELAKARDLAERHDLVQSQLAARRDLQKTIRSIDQRRDREAERFQMELAADGPVLGGVPTKIVPALTRSRQRRAEPQP